MAYSFYFDNLITKSMLRNTLSDNLQSNEGSLEDFSANTFGIFNTVVIPVSSTLRTRLEGN